MRILIMEDDKQVAAFMCRGLREAGHVSDAAHDGEDGLEMARDGQYDVLVVDRMMPRRDGLSVIETLRAEGMATPILILSALGEVDDRVDGLKSGADDYLVKPYAFAELLARVEVLARRRDPGAVQTQLTVGDLEMDLLKHEVSRRGEKIELPAKEYSLLEYMMHNPGRVLSKTSILERVYDYAFDPQTNVVDVLVCRLRNKIDKDFQDKMIHTVRGMGYVLKAR